jgi:hypothetical protein
VRNCPHLTSSDGHDHRAAGRGGQTIRALRFTAYGKRRYLTLGAVSGAVAERELHEVLADVERGLWQSPKKFEPSSGRAVDTDFRALAKEWSSQTAPLISAGTSAHREPFAQ